MHLAARLWPLTARPSDRASGLWLELAGGPALSGTLVRGSFEAGLGYAFKTKRHITIGPSLRYLQVVQPDDSMGPADAKLGLLGIEVMFYTETPPPPSPAPVTTVHLEAPSPPPPDTDGDGRSTRGQVPDDPEDKDGFEDADGCPDPDNDKDEIPDKEDGARTPATVDGVEDADGCPDTGIIELIDDRVVLEEQVLFKNERARVKTSGRKALGAVVAMWKQHPEWDRMEIEGHADSRGKAQFNTWLSDERAKRVSTALVQLGFPSDRLSGKGFGSSRPRDLGSTAEAMQRNRRVELVVVLERPATEPTQPAVAPATVASPPRSRRARPIPAPTPAGAPAGVRRERHARPGAAPRAVGGARRGGGWLLRSHRRRALR